MSEGQQDIAAQPLVIVRRRRSSGDEAHHGGVWKIAYADFMTAMMAFFLVMWLVNAADKKTIVQVAAYFNPVRLTEKTPLSKGVEDPANSEHRKPQKTDKNDPAKDIDSQEVSEIEEEPVKHSAIESRETPEKAPSASSSAAGEAAKEAALFADPVAVLDKIASKAQTPDANAASPQTPVTVIRDPFNPAHRAAVETRPATPPKSDAPKPDPASKDQKSKVAAKDTPASPVPLPDNKDTKEPADPNGITNAADASKLDSEIRQALSKLGATVPNAEVKATSEGLLVSLTDSPEFGMFAVGSAEPRPELVVAIAKVAEILKSRDGRIVIRGHTDGRAYRGGNYDNWRLSAARAQMSYHMLVRGGIDPDKFLGIEGRADRDLKIPEDKTAAQNRRIEILIKAPKP